MAAPPSFFSVEFHRRFLPAVIRQRLSPARGGTGFVSGGVLGFTVGFAACVVLLLVGLPGAVGASADWISRALALVGGGGLLLLLVLSVSSQWSVAPSYEAFHVGVFVFCIALGGSAGLWTAVLGATDRFAAAQSSDGHALVNGALTLGGLVLGYAVGVPAGLWFQRLGPFGSVLGVLAWPAVIGLVATDLVLLSA